ANDPARPIALSPLAMTLSSAGSRRAGKARLLGTVALVVSFVWGALLALLLLGAVLIRSVGLSVYAVSALLVWGGGLLAARRRRHPLGVHDHRTRSACLP